MFIFRFYALFTFTLISVNTPCMNLHAEYDKLPTISIKNWIRQYLTESYYDQAGLTDPFVIVIHRNSTNLLCILNVKK